MVRVKRLFDTLKLSTFILSLTLKPCCSEFASFVAALLTGCANLETVLGVA